MSKKEWELITHGAYLLFKKSHVRSDTSGRNSSESDVSLTALFINSLQGFPWILFLPW